MLEALMQLFQSQAPGMAAQGMGNAHAGQASQMGGIFDKLVHAASTYDPVTNETINRGQSFEDSQALADMMRQQMSNAPAMGGPRQRSALAMPYQYAPQFQSPYQRLY